MTKLVITEKRLSIRRVCEVVDKVYGNGKYKIKYKRGTICIFFPNKDFTHSHAVRIADKFNMDIISESLVRAVIGY